MSKQLQHKRRPTLRPVAQAAALAVVAMAGLSVGSRAVAGPGFADIVLQGGGSGRIGTYFAYSPSGERVTPVPEAQGLPNPSGNPNYTGKALRKFIDPLPLPGAANARKMADGTTDKYIPVAVASKWVKPDGVTVSGDDYYEIALVEYSDRFHTDLRKATTLRGYVQIDHLASNGRGQLPGSKRVALTYPDGQPILINGTDAGGKLTGAKVQALAVDAPRYLGPVIAASRGTPTRLKFINLLPAGRAELGAPDANGKPVVLARNGDLFFPVDKSIVGAGVGPDGVTEYTQNRADIHLHGGDTPWISDGTPHQWITPVEEADTAQPRSLAAEFANPANNLDPALLPHYLRGDSAANVPDMNEPGPGAMTYYFPNGQTARMLWYHDHTFGATRLNVYAGMASGYLLTDATEQAMVGGVLPPAERTLPLVLQDRTFVPDDIALQDARWNTSAWGEPGDSWFPHVYETVQDPAQENNWNAVGRWHYGPWFWPVFPSLYALPSGEYSPAGAENGVTTTPEAWMDTPIINGVAYPTLEVDPTTYRFRLLNATNDRVLTFNLFEAKSTATLADGTPVTARQPGGANADGPLVDVATEIDMVPAAVSATPCAPGVTRPQPIGTSGAVCTPDSWPTDNRLGGVPDPRGVGPSVYQVASEGGWLPQVVKIDPSPITYIQDKGRITVLNVDTKSLLLAPAERADIVVDFSQYAGKTLLVYNDSGAPMPAGDPRNDLFTGVGDQSGSGGTEDTKPGYGPNIRTMMQIRVKPMMAGAAAAPTVADAYNPAPLQAAVAAAYLADQERPTVAQPAYAGFDPAWASLTTAQSYANIYTGSLKEPIFKFTPGTPQAGINSVRVLSAGSGYVTAPAVTIAAPAAASGKAATAQATMKIDNLTVTSKGTGYTSAPVVSIVGGGGNGASATATLEINKVSIAAGAGGSYTTAPTGVSFTAAPAGGSKPVATITTAVIAGSVPQRYTVTGVTITTAGTGYTAAPLVGFTGGVLGVGGVAARGDSSGGVGAVTLTNPDPATPSAAGGGGYSNLNQAVITFTGGNGTGAVARARGKVFDITLTHPGSGYVAGEVPTIAVGAPPAGGVVASAVADNCKLDALGQPVLDAAGRCVAGPAVQASHLVKTKTIQELFDPTYGRLNATFGVELPFTSALTQTTIPLGYVDATTERFADGETQIWKITHNGVDSHPVHFHLMNVQIINRVGWDGYITPPGPRELGWKETIVMSPLEDIIVAVKAKKPELPGFGVPLSVRLMDPTQPAGSPFGFTQIDPTTGFPATVVNDIVNYGWEYVWHCHILGHEENDFMRPVRFDANEAVPSAPLLNSVTSSTSGATLAWTDTSATEFSFDIQRADVLPNNSIGAYSSVGSALANGSGYFDATATGTLNASGGTSVSYKVVAVGAAGNAESAPMTVSLVQGVPAAPTNLVASAQSDSTVQLSWSDSAINEAGFLVERSLDGGASWQPVTATSPVAAGSPFVTNLAVNSVAAADGGLVANTLVSYRVSAVNIDGQSAYATASAITLGAPAIASLNVTPNSASQVTVAWAPVAAAGNQTISSYTLTRTGGAAIAPRTLAGNVTSFLDTGLSDNTTYTYTVNTVNNTGSTPVLGAPTSASTTTPYQPAGTLTSIAALANSNTQATVSWTGNLPATSYLVERCSYTAANFNCTLPSSLWQPAFSVAPPNQSLVDATLTANTTYAYRVTAKNGPINVSNTLVTSVTTPGGVVVSAPQALSAAVSFALARVTLTWTDTATNETTFVVERSVDGVNFAQIGVAAARTGTPAVAGTAGQTRTFVDSAVSQGQTYQYRVRAQNVTGAVVSQSAPSNLISVDYFLAAPSGLTASIASTTRVNLSWVDNSTAEASFIVWRSDNGAAPVQIGSVTRTAAQGTAIGGALVTFANNNSAATPLVLGHSYDYTVTAANGAVVSPASNLSSVSFVAPAAPAALTAPTLTLTSATRATVALSWPAVPGATSYTVQRQSTAGSNAAWTTLVNAANVLTLTEANVRRSATPYVYQIRANGLAGSSAYTQSSFVVN